MMARIYFYFTLTVIGCILLVYFYTGWPVETWSGDFVTHPTGLSIPTVSNKTKTEATVATIFSERRLHIEKECSVSNRTRKYAKIVAGYTPAKLTLCVVPKAACTTWLRLFTYLYNTGVSNRSITSYLKYDIHFAHGLRRVRYNFNGNDRAFINQSSRAMTSRCPYTRLWSAYIDKFILPDFWKLKGTEIIKSVRPNATEKAKRCGYDVSFPEFVQYVLTKGHNINWGVDNHWLPVTVICDPCVFKPDFIVKQETFLSEFTYVINHVGLLDDVKPALQVDQDDFEIESEIDINFKMNHRWHGCATKTEIAKRIWRAMKLNGYLQPDIDLPEEIDEDTINASTLVAIVRSARKRSGANNNSKKVYRRQALKDAYQQLSVEQLHGLRMFYRFDFEMFDYDMFPPI